MRVVEAPNNVLLEPRETTVFLAGGITDCWDWQKKLIAEFKKAVPKDENIVFMNPRRKKFPMDDPSQAKVQIEWEFDHLNAADIIVFYFPKDTLCPIVLYELGFQMGKSEYGSAKCPHIFIAVEPEYERADDVQIQTSLVNYDGEIGTDVTFLVGEICPFSRAFRK